ncbi:MAG: hypothetical protein ACLQG3_03220 [Terracidiphilus sp.]
MRRRKQGSREQRHTDAEAGAQEAQPMRAVRRDALAWIVRDQKCTISQSNSIF